MIPSLCDLYTQLYFNLILHYYQHFHKHFFATVLVLKQTYEQETNHPNIPKSTSAVCVTDQRIVKTLQYRLKHYTDIKLQKKKKRIHHETPSGNIVKSFAAFKGKHISDKTRVLKKNTNTMAIPRF